MLLFGGATGAQPASACNSSKIGARDVDAVTGYYYECRASGWFVENDSNFSSNCTPDDDGISIGSGTQWEKKTLPSCSNATNDKLLYNSTTNAFSCGADQGGSSGYATIREETTAQTQRTQVSFVGPAVTCADDAVTPETDCTVVAAGTGACGANTWASTLNDGAAPTCTQPAFSNLSGTATDSQLASNYSGVGSCAAGAGVSATVDNAGPICDANIVFDDEANTYGAVKQDFGGATVEVPNGIAPPATCAVGEVFHDSNAAAGSRALLCTALDTFTGIDNPFGAAIDDGELASNYSGTGSCTNQFVRALNDNAAPTCAAVADADLANNYSGIGACAANTFASTLVDNAAPTCTQPGFSNLSGTAAIAQGGTTETVSAEDAVLVGAGTTDWQPKTLPSCSAGATDKLLYNSTTNVFSCGVDQTAGGGPSTAATDTRHTIASTTATEVTEIQVALTAGNWTVKYWLIEQSTSATVGFKHGVNYTGTVTRMACRRCFPSTGTTAATGVADDTAAVLTGSLSECNAATVESTTAPNLGPNTGVAAANTNIMVTIECMLVVADVGDLELWHGSEGAVQVSIEVGSSVIATPIP